MLYGSLEDFLSSGRTALAKGPVALIFCEDLSEVDSTIRHHQLQGFKSTIVFAPDALELPQKLEDTIHRIRFDARKPGAVVAAVNKVIDAAPDIWLYYCYNAEFLFFPFCDTRSVGELLAFHTEERRDAMLTYVVDLYAADLGANADAVDLDTAHMDKSGYYALARPDPNNHNHPMDRQLNFYGGLRWRFEEHIPEPKRRIDRVALFRARPGLKLQIDHRFNVPEYNTYSCEWHHNLTAAICSFRTAKALKSNAGSTYAIPTFMWHNSVKFDWHPMQLLKLGLMEPGQWF